jgi:hypothetical protein
MLENLVVLHTRSERMTQISSCLNAHAHRTLEASTQVACTYLDETNIGGVLSEALSADVHVVLTDQAVSVAADSAVQ